MPSWGEAGWVIANHHMYPTPSQVSTEAGDNVASVGAANPDGGNEDDGGNEADRECSGIPLTTSASIWAAQHQQK